MEKSVQQFIKERNDKIKVRFKEVKSNNKKKESLEIVAKEFNLSSFSIHAIVYNGGRKSKTMPKT